MKCEKSSGSANVSRAIYDQLTADEQRAALEPIVLSLTVTTAGLPALIS